MAILRAIGWIIASVVMAIPIAVVVAIGSVPLLRGVEKRWDIEVVGHSGPADWVSWTIWIVISAAIAGSIWLLRGKRGQVE